MKQEEGLEASAQLVNNMSFIILATQVALQTTTMMLHQNYRKQKEENQHRKMQQQEGEKRKEEEYIPKHAKQEKYNECTSI